MAKRINLREYQENVFSRLRSVAASGSTSLAKLGVLIGDEAYLIDMKDVSEVVPVPKMLGVPLVKPWFRGVANVRGNLYSVMDLQDFFGRGQATETPFNRLLLVQPKWVQNASLLVGSMLGLRYTEQMQQRTPAADLPSWILGEYQGSDGRIWREISVGALVQHPDYLKVSVID